MKFQLKIKNCILDYFKNSLSIELNPKDVTIQYTKEEFEGDFTLVVFPLAKHLQKNPQEAAGILGQYLVENIKEVLNYNIIKGFLNLSIDFNFWVESINEEISLPPKQKIILEYSSPNTNKPLHLGHIRNNLLGFSVGEILKATGNEVTKVSIVNDRGIHICKSMIAYQLFGNNETPESAQIKGDHLVGKYYVLFNKIYLEEIENLIQNNGFSKEEAEKKAPIFIGAQDMLRKWEDNDPETLDLWSKMNQWVYDGFEITYKKLGVDFDKIYYESQTYILGKSIVMEGLEKKAFYQKEDKSIWVDLTDEGLDEKLLLRGDGTSVYITQDLGTAQLRMDEFKADLMIYVVGNEQDYHFKVLSLIFKKLNRPWWNKLYHLSYGMVDLPSGKMKSREGTVVDADDLIEEMIQSAKEATLELGKTTDMYIDEQNNLYNKIGMSALKFFLLKVDPKKRMLFDPKESIELQGFTGPFIMYAFARIQSIFRKVNNFSISKIEVKELKTEEIGLLRQLYKQSEILWDASQNFSPAVIANYVYEVAKTFNMFYQNCSVLNEENLDKRQFRLILCKKTAEVIEFNLGLLGISTVDRM
jgi:arginyl-tRNA synthetase